MMCTERKGERTNSKSILLYRVFNSIKFCIFVFPWCDAKVTTLRLSLSYTDIATDCLYLSALLICRIYRVVKKGLWYDLEPKFLMESFSLCIHIFSRSYTFLSYVEKKLWVSKNPENGLFQNFYFFLFLFLLQDNSFSYLVLKFREPHNFFFYIA